MQFFLKQAESSYRHTVYSATVFLSAFLLFWMELFAAKLVLPQMGGSPSVWTTCLVFFQVLLLLGYCCSNWLSRYPLKLQVFIQMVLMGSAIGWLPVALRERTGQVSDMPAIAAVLLLLLSSVGLLFFALSGISPLLQHWFSRMDQEVNPYTLYSASNLGSLASLILYPLWMEPHFGLALQGQIWAGLYILLLLLVGYCGIGISSKLDGSLSQKNSALLIKHEPPSWRQCRSWLMLSCVVSSLLSGVTTYASVNIAPFPMLWAFFLGLYLLSMILVFAATPRYAPNSLVAMIAPIVATGIVAEFLPESVSNPVLASIKLNFVWVGFFLIAWACHGKLAQTKPEPAYLTQFYLWIAIGGTLGGTFNAVLAPLLFKSGREYEIVLLLSLIFIPKVYGKLWNLVSWSGLIGLTCATLMLSNGIYPFTGSSSSLVAIDRSFFGVYQITDDKTKQIRYLQHGITLHGSEFLSPQMSAAPISYYFPSSPFGDIFKYLRPHSANVGVIGLGSGTAAAYAQPNERWKFYEIDPLIVKLAQTYFSFLKTAKAPISVQVGDARLELAKSDDQYDILVVDAFTGDSIPQHLLTQEALQLYLKHLKPEGIIAFHITNRYLQLAPILGRIAEQLDISGVTRIDTISNATQDQTEARTSQWVALSTNSERLNSLPATWLPLSTNSPLWTDDFSSLVSAFKGF